MNTNESSGFFVAPSLSLSESYSDVTAFSSSSSGFAMLYRATKDGKQFILKGLKEEYRNNPIYQELLRKEYDLGYKLDHQHIRRTYGFSSTQGLGSIIVMEYVQGRTLREYMAEKSASSQEQRKIILQLCDALSFAHKLQITHRDLKPENIIITHNGNNVKVIDFGLSDSDEYVSLKGAAGSMRYAAPELMQGRVVDNRADIYSLGVIISELFPSLSKRRGVVARCTMFDPDMRYPSVESVVAALAPPRKWYIYAIITLVVISIAYLLYNSTQSMGVDQYAQSLVPSAQVDNVSEEEFARRQAINSKLYEYVNDMYVRLIESISVDYTVEQFPDFDKISLEYANEYSRAIDSLFVGIEKSSLCVAARRNLANQNSEMVAQARKSFVALFWIRSERTFADSKDEAAIALRKDRTLLDSSGAGYYKYRIATVQTWAIQYRKQHNLSDIPQYLLDHYQEGLEKAMKNESSDKN